VGSSDPSGGICFCQGCFLVHEHGQEFLLVPFAAVHCAIANLLMLAAVCMAAVCMAAVCMQMMGL
jgi:hypothetical protein